jgi:hypothetical protein
MSHCALCWFLRGTFELANVFALSRERSFQKDTIPKPGGLGSSGPLSGLSVRSMSGVCPELVRLLSGAC